ncbi:MAG TPA: primary-amine oxidase [Pseudonocardiaceae bacterium]|nr:primary-amine oxidase [Pseudonocardiaceae bacterium]
MVVDHPLARLSADEIRVARAVLDGAGLVTDATRFAVLALEEPPKQEVLAFAPGDPVNRRVRAVLLDSDTGASRTVLASITRREVEEVTEVDPAADGQPPILLEEFEAVDEIVKANAGWRAAMERRGVTDLDLVCVCPLSAGAFDIPGEEGKRMLRALSFLRHRKSDHPWAHPIDGVVAYVDLTAREVVDLVDHERRPIPEEEGNFDDPTYVGPARTTLRPIEITQPEGPSFSVDGDIVQWAGWSLRIGFDPREGLVLYHISFRDGERDRPVVYRASVAEMVVPYAHPGPVRYWQNYFDAGEYLLGQQANSLVLGCDCLGEIHYLDAVLADNDGEPREIPNAVCLHEEDFGVGWKHTDIFTGSAETRRQRRLVISFFVTVGNYDYGFYWYLYLDGTIQLEVKATGVLFTSSYGDGDEWASEVAPGLGAPFHQHLFNARLDMMVDGLTNAVEEVDVRGHPVGPANPQGNAFGRSVARLTRESQAARSADPAVARSWQIVNPQRTNRMGRPVAYALYPQGQPTLLADERSSIARRAAFATRHLWVTRYDPAERYPAGDLVNQHPGGAGIPSWIARDRSLDGEDLVVWHTFGMTHVPRPEDWPVMPVDVSGFVLKPVGFFDRNPTLDVREP